MTTTRFAVAIATAALALAATSCECDDCGRLAPLPGWASVRFVSDASSQPLADLPVAVDWLNRVDTLATDGDGRIVLEDLDGTGRQVTLSLLNGGTIVPPGSEVVILQFREDTAEVGVLVAEPGTE